MSESLIFLAGLIVSGIFGTAIGIYLGLKPNEKPNASETEGEAAAKISYVSYKKKG